MTPADTAMRAAIDTDVLELDWHGPDTTEPADDEDPPAWAGEVWDECVVDAERVT